MAQEPIGMRAGEDDGMDARVAVYAINQLFQLLGNRDIKQRMWASVDARREPPETRQLYTEHVLPLVRQLAEQLGPHMADRDGKAISIFATLIGTLQLARAVDDAELSDRILAAGADAARILA